MPKFKRRQTEPIEAVQFDGRMSIELGDFLGKVIEGLPADMGIHNWDEPTMTLRLWNSEERQHAKVPAGHWIIKGLKGEFYPCSPEVFEMSYEEIS